MAEKNEQGVWSDLYSANSGLFLASGVICLLWSINSISVLLNNQRVTTSNSVDCYIHIDAYAYKCTRTTREGKEKHVNASQRQDKRVRKKQARRGREEEAR